MVSSLQTIRVGIRASASNKIGGGHIIRCGTLASALTSLGASCSFYSDTSTRGFIPQELAIQFIDHRDIDNQLIHSGFGKFDIFICDHYGLDAKFERALRPNVEVLVVIDDLADRPHD